MQDLLILHFNHSLIIVAKWLEGSEENHFMELIHSFKKSYLSAGEN